MNTMAEAKWSSFVVIFFLAKDVISVQGTCAEKWKSFGNSCYLFVTPTGPKYDPKQTNWKGARSYCLEKSADLVSLRTEEEVNFVYSHTKNLAYNFWIGFNKINRTKIRKNTAWVWSNGDRRNITKWSRNEPDNLDDEHCVEILNSLKFWNNLACDEKRAWICEKPKSVKTQKFVKSIPATAPWKPTSTTKSTNVKPSIMISTKVFPVAMTTRKSPEENMKATKDQTSDTNSSAMSVNTALYIFLPMVLLAFIIVIILLVRKNRTSDEKESPRPRQESNRETEIQQNNNPNFTESDGYTGLHHNREPDNTYTSLDLYENPDDNSDGPYVIANHINHINEQVITGPQAFGGQQRFSYVIPPPNHNYDIPEYR